MTHQYNTRTNKGDFQDTLASIEQIITNSTNSIKQILIQLKVVLVQLKLISKKKLIT